MKEKLIGLTIEEARKVTYSKIRVLCEDGEHFMGTTEVDNTRYNVTTEKGVITEARLG